MTVSSFEIGDLFIFRVFKSLGANPSLGWANTYEAVALAAGTEAALLALGTTLVDFEQVIHHNDVTFQRLTISTWVPDSSPYDPAAFISSSLSGTGSIGPTSDLVGLNVTVNVARVAAFGRQGHLFYRGWLDESQVSSPAGEFVLTDKAGLNSDLQGAIASSGLDGFIGQDATTLALCMVNADGDQVRNIVGFVVNGVSTVPTKHKWFNRSTITVP